jgi:hypothetical protein
MELVPIAEAIIKSPYGLTLVLCVIVWWQNVVIKQKDLTIKEKDELIQSLHEKTAEKQQERETLLLSFLEWHQKLSELYTKIVQNMGNDVRDSWTILREWFVMKGGKEFEHQISRDDEDASISDDDDSGLHHLRSKLSKRGSV